MKELGKIGYFNFFFLFKWGLAFCIEEANIYIFSKKKKMISAHLDAILVNLAKKVNIRLFNQKLIIFDIVTFP